MIRREAAPRELNITPRDGLLLKIAKGRAEQMLNLKEKTLLMDELTAARAVRRMAYEIIERNTSLDGTVIIGIQKRGAVLARALRNEIEKLEGTRLPMGSMDITFYRDDLTMLNEHPVITGNDIPFGVYDKNIILVDDVLFTGRTIRSAIDEIFDMGRPKKIELAILVDRGHRELPIRADYIGKNVPTRKDEHISMEISEDGRITKVSICEKEA